MVETKITEGRFFPEPDEIGEGFTIPDLSDLIPSNAERQSRTNLNFFGEVIQKLVPYKAPFLPQDLIIRLKQ